MEAISTSETSVLTRATRRNKSEDAIFHAIRSFVPVALETLTHRNTSISMASHMYIVLLCTVCTSVAKPQEAHLLCFNSPSFGSVRSQFSLPT
jgi:hypothetical protein